MILSTGKVCVAGCQEKVLSSIWYLWTGSNLGRIFKVLRHFSSSLAGVFSIRRLASLWLTFFLVMVTFDLAFSQSTQGEEKQVWKRQGNKWRIDNSNGATFTVFDPKSSDGTGFGLAAGVSSSSSAGVLGEATGVDLTATTTIEPWIHFSITATRLDWFVRKPGTYAMRGASLTVSSNSAVLVDFEGFANLVNQEDPAQSIGAYYGVEQPGMATGLVNWITASNFNSSDRLLIFSEGSPSKTLDLWNMISVSQSNSSCEYEDEAVITLSIQVLTVFVENQKSD